MRDVEVDDRGAVVGGVAGFPVFLVSEAGEGDVWPGDGEGAGDEEAFEEGGTET